MKDRTPLVIGVLLVAGVTAACGAAPRPAESSAPQLTTPPVTPAVAVGAEYDTTHVYVTRENVDRFCDSFLATFGGETSKQVVVTVTPTPSATSSQLLRTPVGIVSLFGFRTPVPYPFGSERTGYLVADLDVAVRAARTAGADVLVEPFSDPIGRDAVIQWPGGVNMQLYWHFTKPAYPKLGTIPENRVYVSADRVSAFLGGFLSFSHGSVVLDDAHAPGVEIGLPGKVYRRVRVESAFGKLTVLVTDGHLPYPYGYESTGYEVTVLADTLAKAKAAGVEIVVPPYSSDDRDAALLHFPGGYIAEVHAQAASSPPTNPQGL
ncbi:MAG: glyoxalase [Pseudomonadota bacterium]